MSKKKFLVTGGTGFIGSALVHRLVSDGYAVRVLDNNSRGKARRLNDIINKSELVEADIRDFNLVNEACKGIDVVFHLAYINGTEFFYSKPELVLEVAVKGIINILEASIKNGIKEFVLASSSEVYQTAAVIPTDESVALSVPDPSNPRYSYGGGKIICEIMTLNFGQKYFTKTLIFRPHNVYGPDMVNESVIPQFIIRMKDIAARSDNNLITFPIQGTGDETRAFVFIDDFIDGLMLMFEKGENLNIYHIGTMSEIRISDLAVLIGKCFSKEIDLVFGVLQKGGTIRRCPDISKLKKLGYNPQITLEAGIRKTAMWYIKN